MYSEINTTFCADPLNASFALIVTSQLICLANQLTCFCMRATLAFNGLKSESTFEIKVIFGRTVFLILLALAGNM